MHPTNTFLLPRNKFHCPVSISTAPKSLFASSQAPRILFCCTYLLCCLTLPGCRDYVNNLLMATSALAQPAEIDSGG